MSSLRLRLAATQPRAAGQWRWAALALILALGSLTYFALVYLPTVAQFNAEHGNSGYGSDLYSRWYGARELLQHGRDPYSAALTAEMQRGFVGHDPLPGENTPEWAVFAQPIYTVLLVAPLTLLDFPVVQLLATIAFPLMIASGGLFWMLALGAPRTPQNAAVALLLAISAPATLYAANFQQLSAPVFLLLAAAFLLLARGKFAWAGLLLALSTIKPQESGLLIALLLFWALFAWRARRALVISFAGSMIVLLVIAEVLLPGWIFEFVASLTRYSAQTQDLQIFAPVLPSAVLALLAALWIALLAWVAWQVRREADSPRLALAGACALAITVVIIPAYLQYERIFLLPALLALLSIGLRRQAAMPRGMTLAATLLLTPWALATLLGAAAAVGLLNVAAGLTVLPWLPYLPLPYLAALALLPLLRSAKGVEG